MNQLGLFDLTTSPKSSEMANKDLEIARLKEELSHARSRLNSWDESYAQARSACEAWKKETAISTKKAELALREKDGALAQLAQLQKEMESAGPYVHGVRRVAELKTMPVGVLKTIEWQLRKDLFEVEKVGATRCFCKQALLQQTLSLLVAHAGVAPAYLRFSLAVAAVV